MSIIILCYVGLELPLKIYRMRTRLYKNDNLTDVRGGTGAQSNIGYRETVDIKEQWARRNSGHRGTEGTMDTDEQWAQRKSGDKGTVGTKER